MSIFMYVLGKKNLTGLKEHIITLLCAIFLTMHISQILDKIFDIQDVHFGIDVVKYLRLNNLLRTD